MILKFNEFINESFFTKDDKQEFIEEIKTELKKVVPEVGVKTGIMGSDTLYVNIVFQPKDEWSHGIWQNANHISIMIEPDGTMEETKRGIYKKGTTSPSFDARLNIKFRKAKGKSKEDIIKRLVKHATLIMNEYK